MKSKKNPRVIKGCSGAEAVWSPVNQAYLCEK